MISHLVLPLWIETLVMSSGRKIKTLAEEEGVYFKMTQFIFRGWDDAPWEAWKKRKRDYNLASGLGKCHLPKWSCSSQVCTRAEDSTEGGGNPRAHPSPDLPTAQGQGTITKVKDEPARDGDPGHGAHSCEIPVCSPRSDFRQCRLIDIRGSEVAYFTSEV